MKKILDDLLKEVDNVFKQIKALKSWQKIGIIMLSALAFLGVIFAIASGNPNKKIKTY